MHHLILITALSATTGLCGGHKKANCAPTPCYSPAPVCAPAPACAPAPVCETRVKKHCGLGGLLKRKGHGCAAPAPVCDVPTPCGNAAPVYYQAGPAPSPQAAPQYLPTPQAPGKTGYAR